MFQARGPSDILDGQRSGGMFHGPSQRTGGRLRSSKRRRLSSQYRSSATIESPDLSPSRASASKSCSALVEQGSAASRVLQEIKYEAGSEWATAAIFTLAVFSEPIQAVGRFAQDPLLV